MCHIASPAPILPSPMPMRYPILMDMSDSPPDLNGASLRDSTPIDVPTTPHEVSYKIIFSVHAFVRHDEPTKHVPLVNSTIVIFHGILDSLPSPPQVQHLVLDYEEAIWKAIQTVMPNIHVTRLCIPLYPGSVPTCMCSN
ncbi:hypothetical protein LSH36_237g01030 [Paralvinella palmiformis]|uniref:Uncharacterized protein n=1 Tax=Paralvinella palmiformis TaxID=53620 RepID=A0AAD9N389_9ANNE|nr:hypothetical protein LSH36_237g01030 [Paralvinella palmiformis]